MERRKLTRRTAVYPWYDILLSALDLRTPDLPLAMRLAEVPVVQKPFLDRTAVAEMAGLDRLVLIKSQRPSTLEDSISTKCSLLPWAALFGGGERSSSFQTIGGAETKTKG